ncbi:hypothetical protein KJ750_00010 [Patescibacteria group bacterium]|nr:hypothetical protein [Patescibacteria group bacterium]
MTHLCYVDLLAENQEDRNKLKLGIERGVFNSYSSDEKGVSAVTIILFTREGKHAKARG